MLYKFQSKTSGDVIMLQPHGQRLLEIMGKYLPEDPSGAGILLPEHMAVALSQLKQAIDAEEQAQAQARAQAEAQGLAAPRFESVGLRHRATPLMKMIERAAREEVSITWNT